MDDDWPFDRPRNAAAFTQKQVLEGRAEIVLVIHDADGDWQFLDGGPANSEELIVVCLEHMLDRDATLREIASLPPDTWAERPAVGGNWKIY